MRSDDTREGRNMKKTKWRQRLRGISKWGGVLCCALIVGLWVVSEFRTFVWKHDDSHRSTGMILEPGGIEYWINPGADWIDENSDWGILRSVPEPTWADYWEASFASNGFRCPFWIPLVLIALPTGFLFWSDHRRRMRAGCCGKCGYDLTGNTTGRCPECGATTAKAASS